MAGERVREATAVQDIAEAGLQALAELLDDPGRREAMGKAGRARAEAEFAYDVLAARLADALDAR